MPDYALAIDLGTTTLAASLLDCGSGQRIAMTGALNPQRCFGADVVSRLDAAIHSEAAKSEMTSLIRAELLRMGQQLCQQSGTDWNDVRRAAIAGNPAMQHILLGLPLKSLASPPYRPLQTSGTHLKAFDLDWDGQAQIYVFPMPGGFVGGDTVAFIHGAKPDDATLCLDMGTNGEIALISRSTIWATSAAAGPAFEGGNLSCGMAALPGAINSVQFDGDRVRLQVISGGQPLGICGSAAIEALCELLRCGVVEPGGRLRDAHELSSNLASRIISHQGANAFALHRDAQRRILLTQDDIRQLQLAKSALRAGIEVLTERSCIQCQALRNVLLTGSFGAVLRAEWLKTIGIFDESMIHISRFQPEGALAGAETALMQDDGFRSVEKLGQRFRVVPLSGTPLFETRFIQNIDFPVYRS